jgi:hypothetical protein
MVAADHDSGSRLAVVLPTLNCRGLLPAHLRSMRPWLKAAHEVVVVDSYSQDGTVEYLRENLRHPNVRIFSRPRGLYQSWNFGIQQTASDWIYVSTVGDSIAPALLQHLREVGGTLDCDVVVSRPDMVNEDDTPAPRMAWPIDHILRGPGASRPVRLAGVDAMLFALLAIPNALLGSSASNLYRGSHLRARPFPTEFGTVGDTAWTLRFGLGTTYGFTPARGSCFRLHAKAYTQSEYAVDNLCARLAEEALGRFEAPGHAPSIQAAMAKYRLIETARMLVGKFRSAPVAAVGAGSGSREGGGW